MFNQIIFNILITTIIFPNAMYSIIYCIKLNFGNIKQTIYYTF